MKGEVERRQVVEWRFTFKDGNKGEEHVTRWWIESDPKHGGVDYGDAAEAAAVAVRDTADLTLPYQRARMLLDMVPAANAVEVVDAAGDGVVAYRDWP